MNRTIVTVVIGEFQRVFVTIKSKCYKVVFCPAIQHSMQFIIFMYANTMQMTASMLIRCCFSHDRLLLLDPVIKLRVSRRNSNPDRPQWMTSIMVSILRKYVELRRGFIDALGNVCQRSSNQSGRFEDVELGRTVQPF